jgi:SAM-dependent methyltransferase
MHGSSFEAMKNFVEKYLNPDWKLTILDIGSQDVSGGSYRPLFAKPGWQYWGGDLVKGENVDIVFENKYDFGSKQYDLVISGQTLEHIENMQAWIRAVERVVKPGGFVCIIAPYLFREHRVPVDCWRILPDGMRYLLEDVAGLKIIEITNSADLVRNGDCVGIGRKNGINPV